MKASTGLLKTEGHADVVAARSRTEERTAEGRIIGYVYVYCGEFARCPREGCVWSRSESCLVATEGRVADGSWSPGDGLQANDR